MKQSLSSKGITWTDFQAPSNDELAEFVRATGVLPIDAEFIVQDHQRPEVTARDAYILVLVHVPGFDTKSRVTSGVALYVLVTQTQMFTLHYNPIITLQRVMKDFEEQPEKQEEYFSDTPISLALYAISKLNNSAFRKVQKLVKHTEIAEDAVFHGNERKMVEEIAVLSRDVLDFRRIGRSQVGLFNEVPEGVFDHEATTQWRRLGSQTSQLWEMLESVHESIQELRNANDSMLQHKENELLRMLTLYSIITIPLWVFVGPYNPRGVGATIVDYIVFWSVIIGLVLVLIYIFMRAKKRKVF